MTFVNGRTRAQITPELEGILNLPISPEPMPEDFAVEKPDLDSEEVRNKVKSQDSAEWRQECERGLRDTFLIAKARLKSLGLDGEEKVLLAE